MWRWAVSVPQFQNKIQLILYRRQFFLWCESCLATFASLVSIMCNGMKESPMEHTELGTETVDWNVNVVSQIRAPNGKGTVSIYTVCKVLIQWMKSATLLTVEFCWSMFLSRRDPAAQGLHGSLLQLRQQNTGVQAQGTSCYRQL